MGLKFAEDSEKFLITKEKLEMVFILCEEILLVARESQSKYIRTNMKNLEAITLDLKQEILGQTNEALAWKQETIDEEIY